MGFYRAIPVSGFLLYKLLLLIVLLVGLLPSLAVTNLPPTDYPIHTPDSLARLGISLSNNLSTLIPQYNKNKSNN